jgi:predicted nucleic acid-binding Zn ribbon protein
MKDEPLKNCPDCNGELKRLIGAGAGPIFKGSGFYQTDYKNSSKSSETKKAEKAIPAEKSSNENKTEKKGTTDK